MRGELLHLNNLREEQLFGIAEKTSVNNPHLHFGSAHTNNRLIVTTTENFGWLKQIKETDPTNELRQVAALPNAVPEIKLLMQIGRTHIFALEFPHVSRVQLQQAADMLARNALVEHVELDYILQTNATPDDTFYNIHQSSYMNMISAPMAWNTRTSSGATVIAILDDGIELTHSDLVANLWKNPGEVPNDFVDNDLNGIIDDYDGANLVGSSLLNFSTPNGSHGTEVAGVAGAVGNNALGSAGVVWSTKLMPVQIVNSTGTAAYTDIIEGINYAVEKGAHVINASLGSPTAGNFPFATLTAIKGAQNAGAIFVGSSGNNLLVNGDDSDTKIHPAGAPLPNVLNVMGISAGGFPRGGYGQFSVDVAAPYDAYTTTTGNSFTAVSGTSFSAPMIAASAAMLMDHFPGEDNIEIADRVRMATDVNMNFSTNNASGGTFNLAKAYTARSVFVQMSGLGEVSTTNQAILGFVVKGPSTNRVVVRVLGPALASFGISNPLPNPKVTLYKNGSFYASNDDWQALPTADLAYLSSAQLAPNFADEPALVLDLASGSYTAVVETATSSSGVILAETHIMTYSEIQRVHNASFRSLAPIGASATLGLVVAGDLNRRILWRGLGPSLANYGVSQPANNVTIGLYDSAANLIDSNDNHVVYRSPNNWHFLRQLEERQLDPPHALDAAVLATSFNTGSSTRSKTLVGTNNGSVIGEILLDAHEY